ncbi:MAG: hypothetical protein IKW18_07960, partial [Clostridia bacterium]|nr:hypothetical protein [Clostridia bacterium]
MMRNYKNFERAIVTLEFDKIREMLASVCPTEGAKALARNLRPSRGIGTVRRMVLVSVFFYSSCRRKRSSHGKNFTGKQNRSFISALRHRGDVDKPRKRRHAFRDLHCFCRIGLLQHTAHRSDATGRTQ